MRANLVCLWAFIAARNSIAVNSIDDELVIPNETESAGSADQTCSILKSSNSPENNTYTVGKKEREEPEIVEELEIGLDGDTKINAVLFSNETIIKYPFGEELTLKPLPRNFMLASFAFELQSNNFTVGKTESAYDTYRHYTVFPKALSPILEYTQTRQLHLRFTHGRWDAESWGQLPHNGTKSGGNGVELWAVVEAGSQHEAFENWIMLANSLSGLFCSSINFIDVEKTTYPVSSFQPAEERTIPIFNSSNQAYLLRAALANEPICTENLTPFLKLLPTRGRSGISSLLDGHKVFDSNWHSLSIDVETSCNGDTCQYQMEENIEMVFNVPNSLARADNPIPKPVRDSDLQCDESKPHDSWECFPLPQSKHTNFQLSKLFGKKILGSNLISENPSKVCAQVSDSWTVYVGIDDDLFATDDNCFTIKNDQLHDIHLKSDNTAHLKECEDVPLFVSRSLTGYGQDSGGLRTVFSNPSNESVQAIYFESLPWYMRLYLSSLKIESDAGLEIGDVIKSTFYLPAIDRERPTHLEFNITIPAETTLALTYQFDKALLKYAEYPPDANHGFEIESALVTVLTPIHYEMRTTTLLLSLSTPDFSMPYNVIILTSTVMGLAFGTLFNLMVKKLVTIEEADKKASAKVGLKAKLIAKLKKLKGKGDKVNQLKKDQ
ncbi:LAME_0H01420g1_1 [Lachancea meyersii CBS 8951]|uniref:LAME_0H01420g1_1 n=1 Tax=Lachancea meyersii CBS 8951 TaxID=1266667 RepID=A0A1G4KDG0_9SACH|nr:LAME_0H01420g1_1 [Lachancea meyersii CBS 8951]